ncbi:RWD domain-containing protein isoform 2 [Schistosoma japonicum]|uniref:RWD domain-containing protein isoform 2 n=1 Tax=Schistosoma japonicum TaxID=6182 RepID=A0A4Z2DLN7_SCHJA|nr:RWD domain-containing protein isoform 2 [Schistosoma japonicum]TNN17415.1 RWD domain-containing protein isoform 2 [Schistosoma japonicum]
MAVCDLREEEAQVLKSIFSEDELTISGDYKLEYKVGEHGTISSFVIQIQWPTGYPNVMPYISMDCFYNQHVPQDVKEKIVAELVSVAEDQLGSALTYILVEYIKENHERFVKWFSIEKVDKSQPDSISNEASVGMACFYSLIHCSHRYLVSRTNYLSYLKLKKENIWVG